MRGFIHLKKLNQRGFDHVLIGLAFAVIIALGGTYYLLETHANNFGGALKINMSKANMCMENEGNSNVALTTVELNNCNSSSAAQHWSLQAVPQLAGAPKGTYYQIVAATSKACVDDYKQRITPAGAGLNPAKAAFVITWQCNSADKGQLWRWGGTGTHQLINAGSGGCINDPQSLTKPQTRLIVFSCSQNGGGNTNAQWIEVANSASSNGNGGSSSTSTGPITSQPGEIQASVGNSMCITAGNTTTLQSCANTAAQQWGQVDTVSGSNTEQFYNQSTNTYLGVSGTKIVDTAASGNALWSASDNGNGTNTLEQLNGSGNTGMCLDAGNGTGALTLTDCASGTSQSFTLPIPYVAPQGNSQSSGSNSVAAIETPVTVASPSTSNSQDISYLLQLLKTSGHPVECNLVSTTNRLVCNQINK